MRFLTLAALLITLSACAAGPDEERPRATTAAQTTATHYATADQPPAGGPAKIKVTAQQLLGQNDAWLVAHLGHPTFRRADRVASLWQYKNHQCMLNVFLYADESNAAAPKRILHFDARDSNGHNTDREHCLTVLQD
ncbi:MAG: hypothetical protein NUV50_06890 [Rhodospirillales bacterium]|nr:hypothetical protein [Rhodospirillales bacterium]